VHKEIIQIGMDRNYLNLGYLVQYKD
jgi:hypothetical protein